MIEALAAMVEELELTDHERIPLAVVLAADVRQDGFEGALQLARVDWRDVLVQGGLERHDWRQKVDQILAD